AQGEAGNHFSSVQKKVVAVHFGGQACPSAISVACGLRLVTDTDNLFFEAPLAGYFALPDFMK
ncbi:MAG: hypothetical protein KDC75_24265, partial [Phaeodactylibacter sp.]|nr:hypothetical protein [Phaeodactylibacter sp.]